MFGNKVGGALASFAVMCDGFNGGKWRVLGPSTTPSKFHSSWIGGQQITSLTVYKWLNPALGYYVVSSVTVCTLDTATNTNSCHGFAPIPQCSAPSKICVVETTTAPSGQTLSNWYFKTILNSAANTETPGNLLELKASVTPFAKAPVMAAASLNVESEAIEA